MAVVITRSTYVEELLTPAPDGGIVNFQTSQAYELGHVQLWRNGMLLASGAANGYTELGGTNIQFNEAPGIGDTLEVRYNPA